MGETNPLDTDRFHSQQFQIEGISVITSMSHLISLHKILSDHQNFSCEKDLIICNLLVVSIIDECGQGVVRLRERTRASSMYVRERLLCTGRFGPTLIKIKFGKNQVRSSISNSFD